MVSRARGSVAANVGDAVRAVVIMAGLAAVAVVVATFGRPEEQLPEAVDYTGVLEYVRSEYSYPVLAPAQVPDGWRATSVDHSATAAGDQWRLGFLTADRGFVGLEQSDGEIQSYLADRLREYRPDGTVRIGADQWERHLRRDGERRALVRTTSRVVTIVYGTLDYDSLAMFARTLRP